MLTDAYRVARVLIYVEGKLLAEFVGRSKNMFIRWERYSGKGNVDRSMRAMNLR